MTGFNAGNFLTTLPILVYGMAGIFVVILTIYASVVLLRGLFPPDTKNQ